MTLQLAVNGYDHKQGDVNAPLVMVEYGDYECPYCGEAYPIVKKLQNYFGEKLLFVFRNFPLTEIHPYALGAATAAEAASFQNKFWRVHDTLFENQNDLSHEKLLAYARKLGLDVKQLAKDMTSYEIGQKIEKDLEGGARSGVNGTPTFFINGKRHNGYFGYEELKDALEQSLK